MDAISVTRYNTYIKQIFDAEELLHNIQIIGEVFGVSFSRQTAYFSLKDDESSLQCMCFDPYVASRIKEGQLIVVTGSPNYYTKGGRLNFIVNKFENAGKGLLYQKFIELKEQLEKEGLFSQEHKKAIPKNIKRIGVITSQEGAVIRDIINITTRRDPSIDIVLFPVKVQGNGSENEISTAIYKMSKYDKVDVIVVARGGGSLEDLWAYNTEIVARAVYECEKPIVSAVGHETDYTIIDFVADLRAPTPSAAAELLTYNLSEKRNLIISTVDKLIHVMKNYYFNKKIELVSLRNSLIDQMQWKLSTNKGKLDKIIAQLANLTDSILNNHKYELDLLDNSLRKLSPKGILQRGYAKIEQQGKVLDKVKDVMLSSDIEINFIDGKLIASPKRVEE